MRLSVELNSMINLQIAHELKNANIYKQIQSHFEDLQLTKIADYFKSQSQGEVDHANKFINHLNSRIGGRVRIEEVESPNLSIISMDDIARIYLETEELTTQNIEEIMSEVMRSQSFIDVPFINEMLAEQVEEEDIANRFAVRIVSVKDLILFDATFGG